MTRPTLSKYAAKVRPRYARVRKRDKERILDEFCETTGLHRKAAIRLLGRGRGLAVRRSVGHDRYSSKSAFAALGRMYALTRLQLNFWRPVRKLIGKERHGARVRKRYAPAPESTLTFDAIQIEYRASAAGI